MKKNKKAMDPVTLTLYIILVATTLTLAGAVAMYGKLATKDARKKACEFDINKAVLSKKIPAADKLFTRGYRQTSLTNCRRDKLGNLEIRYEDIVENGIINQDKAHKIIADEMVECWKMAGAGTKDPFSNWEGKGESYCMICSTIKFDERLTELYKKGVKKDEKGRYVISKEDFKKYTIQPIYPYLINKEIESGVKYWEFLYNEEAIEYKDTESYASIAPDSTIIIQMYKLESKGWIVTGYIVGGVLIGVGLIATIPSAGASLGLSALGATIIGVGGLVVGVAGVATVVHASFEAYRECEDCNAIGGMQLIPPEREFDIKLNVKLGNEEKQIPLCSIIVN